MSQSGDSRTLPDRIADRLIARIITGDLRPGDRLPAERELASQLNVDRTSLRMALRQLVRINLIATLRGSGITVLDWREHAGLDLLAAAFANPDIELGAAFHLEALDHYISMTAGNVAAALNRATTAELLQLDSLMLRQLKLLKTRPPIAEIVDRELEIQDAVTRLQGSTIARLVGNSSRPLRRRMLALYFEGADVRRHVEGMRRQLRALLQARPPVEVIERIFRDDMVARTRALRARIATLPAEPRLRKSA